MSDTSLIKKIRSMLTAVNGSETKAIATDENIKSLWKDRQALVLEMNKAKKIAAEEAAIPYLDLIKDIDEQYAMMIALVSDSSKKDES